MRRVSSRYRASSVAVRHELPASLPRPPADWRVPYGRMARTVGLDADLDAGFDLAARMLDPDSRAHRPRWRLGPCQSDLDLTPRQAGCSADRRRRHRGGDRGYPCFLQCFGAYVCGGVAKPDISVDDHRALEPALLTSSIAPSSRTPSRAPAPAFDFRPRRSPMHPIRIAARSPQPPVLGSLGCTTCRRKVVRSMPRPQARPGNQSRAPPVVARASSMR